MKMFGIVAFIYALASASIPGYTQAVAPPTTITPTAPVVVSPARPAYRWDNVVIGGVEYATGLVWSPTNPKDLYLRADGGGIWRLDRTKKRWVALMDQMTWKDRNLNVAESVAVDPRNPQVLYVAGGGSQWGKPHDVLKSVNGGKSWSRTRLKNDAGEDVLSMGNGPDKQGGERLCVDPNDSRTVWFATRNDGLFVSRDAAKTWRNVKSFPVKGGRFTGLTFVQPDPRRRAIYVGVHAGAATDAPDAAKVPGGVYRSADNGETWAKISDKGPEGGNVSPLRMRIAPGGTLYVTTVGAGVWRKKPGAAWQNITPPDSKESGEKQAFCGINFDPRTPRRIVCSPTYGTTGTIYYSDNGGDSWRTYTFDRNNPRTGGIAVDDFPAWDSKPGFHWGEYGSDVAFDPADSSVVYHTSFSGANVLTGIGSQQAHARLLGDGREQMTTGAGVSPSAGAAFVSGVWDVGGFRHTAFDKIPQEKLPLFRADGSQDKEEWRRVFQDIFDMDAAPKMSDVIAIAGGWMWNNTGTAAVSRDNGKTFREFATKPFADAKFGRVAVSATDADNIIWMPMDTDSEKRPVYFTRDGGKTWGAAINAPVGMINAQGPWTFFKPLAADRERPHTFYLYDRRDGGFFASVNGGETWERRAILPKQLGLHFDQHRLMASPGIAGDLWLSLSEQGLLHSTDGGKTWAKLTGVRWSVQIALGKPAPGAKNPTVFCYGQIGGILPKDDTSVDAALYRSQDMGKTWVRINPDTMGLSGIVNLTADMQMFGRVYAGTGGGGFFYGEPVTSP